MEDDVVDKGQYFSMLPMYAILAEILTSHSWN